MIARRLLALLAPLALAGCLQLDQGGGGGFGGPADFGFGGSAFPGLGSAGGRPNTDDQLQRGTRACVQAANRAGYRVERIRDAGRSGKNNVEVTMKARRKGKSGNLDCVYDGGRGRTRLHD